MDGVKCEQSLAPEWLSFSRELPSSSQDKIPRHTVDRDKHRHFGKHNSYHHLTQLSPSPSYSYALSPSTSSNWRHADPNPRMLNRSKSSPVFDSKDSNDSPKSPDRSNLSSSSTERHFQPPLVVRPKPKFKGKPPLMSSRSQPNLFTSDSKGSFQQQKLRSPPVRGSSFLSLSSLVPSPSSPSSPSHSPTPSSIPSTPLGPTTMAMAVASTPPPPAPVVPPSVDLDLEMEKLRTLVPSPSVASAPKPARLVGGRKGSHPKPLERPKKPATPPSILHLRKATSEPALLANPNAPSDELLRKMKAMNAEKAKAQLLKEIVEEKDKVVANRNNFFMDVYKRERQIQDSVAEVLEHNNSEAPDSSLAPVVPSSSPTPVYTNELFTPPETNEANIHLLPEGEPLAHQQDINEQCSCPASTVEAEERFLRLLGWVPDEEDHVPELDEEEIAEVLLKINNNRHQQGGPHSPTSPLRSNYTATALGLGLARGMMTVSIHQD